MLFANEYLSRAIYRQAAKLVHGRTIICCCYKIIAYKGSCLVCVFPPEGMLKCCKIQLFALGGSSALDVVVMRMDTLVDWGLITAALQLKLCWPTI